MATLQVKKQHKSSDYNPELIKRFFKDTGSKFDPNSQMDVYNLQLLEYGKPPIDRKTWAGYNGNPPIVNVQPTSVTPTSVASVGAAPISVIPIDLAIASTPVIPQTPTPFHAPDILPPTAPVATAPVATAPVATAPVATAPVATAPVATAPIANEPPSLIRDFKANTSRSWVGLKNDADDLVNGIVGAAGHATDFGVSVGKGMAGVVMSAGDALAESERARFEATQIDGPKAVAALTGITADGLGAVSRATAFAEKALKPDMSSAKEELAHIPLAGPSTEKTRTAHRDSNQPEL